MNHCPRRNILVELALGFAFAACARAPQEAARPPAAPVAPAASAPATVDPPAESVLCTHDACKDTDPDRDGIHGTDDKCPLHPETIDGKNDEDGCPG
ncbi:hypothetical protein [Nannocystis punicea]|uniref:Thrombospondin type 3 repeat-containing protein n=1 Tax=Nannocystis punicea TaxID=2995304 RepID=A0ABY7HEM8_9BACT|nr:hypothetical protein [Nannocystis poenicansa]WAS97419.1 hypothetical protein O0S08_14825 [Nannocystis poenicansa]